jgi:hypothetical protein
MKIISLTHNFFDYYQFFLITSIERPFRNKNNKFKVIKNLVVISISIIIVFNFFVIENNGFKKRFYVSEFYELDKQNYSNENKNFEINYNYDNYNDRKNVLLVGNSHAEDILEILSKTYLKKKNLF